MAGVNKVILIGHLGKDPEMRTFEGGRSKTAFTLATSESYKNKNGERITQTEWHNVVVWSPLAEIAEKYLKKGKLVYIEGRITNRSYDDKDGVKKYITEIVGQTLTMLGKAENETEQGGNFVRESTDPISVEGEIDDLPF